MRKFIIIAASVAALAGPTAAMAAAPDGQFNFKDNGASENASSIGKDSSQITQNGQFVSGQGKHPGSIRRPPRVRVPRSCRPSRSLVPSQVEPRPGWAPRRGDPSAGRLVRADSHPIFWLQDSTVAPTRSSKGQPRRRPAAHAASVTPRPRRLQGRARLELVQRLGTTRILVPKPKRNPWKGPQLSRRRDEAEVPRARTVERIRGTSLPHGMMDRTQEVGGSSPPGSIGRNPHDCAGSGFHRGGIT